METLSLVLAYFEKNTTKILARHFFSNFATPKIIVMNLSKFFTQLSKTKKIILIALPSLLIVAGGIIYLFVPTLIRHTIAHKIKEIEQEKNISITYAPIEITHFSLAGKIQLAMTSLQIQSNNAKEPLLQIDSLSTKVRIWKGFHRCHDIQKLAAKNIQCNLIKRGNYNNYRFLQSQKKKQNDERNYQNKINHILSLLGEICPNELKTNKLDIYCNIDSLETNYLLSPLNIKNEQLNSYLTITNQEETTKWILSGCMDNQKQIYDGSLTLDQPGKTTATLSLPFRVESLNAECHQISGNITVKHQQSDCTQLSLSGRIEQFTCAHRYLADQPVLIDSIGAQLNISVFKEKIEIDSTSTIHLNETDMHPFLRYEHLVGKHIVLKINEKEKDAAQLFRSLPNELFQVLPKLQVAGELDYGLMLDCDFGNLDSLKFDFNIGSRKHNFRIVSGIENITRFNEPFEYIFYENGDTARVVNISPDNVFHCPFSQIPNYLKQSILAAEDGAFFQHRGFLKSPIQSALISDLKAKRLVRGGSTISMQLVKNLFLNRKKQLSRKFEELLLVWMIEDYRMLTKDRMFEIYVNIAEWGPRIIGIGEAAAFYFNKRPADLTLSECVYLASLIRAPKHYQWTIDDTGMLTDVKQQEISAVAQRMLERGFITEEEFNKFAPSVQTVQTRSTSSSE